MNTRAALISALAFAVAACASAFGAEEYVWWEAEQATARSADVSDRHWLDSHHEELSGGVSLGSGRGNAATFLEFEVDVPSAGEWNFYVRKFWHHGPFKYRWNDGDWSEVNRRLLLLDTVGLKDHCINWKNAGKVDLRRGPNALRIEAIPKADGKFGAFVIDCFVLTQKAFTPRGKMKPGEKYGRAPEGWFPFEPDRDAFGKALLDLREFNEGQAGSYGFVQARGRDLVFEKTGKTVRFWGVTACSGVWRMKKQSMDYLARRLAKMGVNMVRFHAAPFYHTEPGPELDGIHYLTAALKKQGIYSGFSWYCLAGAEVQDSWGLEGFSKGDRPMSLLFFYPPLQKIYRQWTRTLLATRNPYTGLPLARDPAVAYIEIVDEDNYFFWTFRPEKMNPKALPYLERKFGAWLKKRHGTLQAAARSWGPGRYPKGDDFGAGRVALYGAGFLTGADWALKQRNQNRARDQVRFLTEDLRAFHADTKSWIKDDLGYRGVVVTTNWKTADERVLGPLDQYVNMAGDATARNTYFSGPCKGPRAGYSINKGDRYQDRSVLLNPQAAAMMHIQARDYPHLLTEGGWAMPNRFRAEEPFMEACYGSLQGIDAFFPFVLERDWNNMQKKWPIQTPATMGQYPAAAVIYRNGYVKEGPLAINEALRLDDLYGLKGGAMSQPLGLDAARASDVPAGVEPEVESLSTLDPLAFYVGRVVRTIGEAPGKSRLLRNLSKYIDRANKIVKSATGELVLDYGRGLATMNAPCAQGATGFLRKAGTLRLADVTVEGRNEYGTVLVVSMDGKPLKTSDRILVQVMTEEKNYGWKTRPARARFGRDQDEVDCKEIVEVGAPPTVVRKFDGTVTLRRPDAARLRVTALDHNGYTRKELPGGRGDRVTVELLEDCLYYVIHR